MIAFARRGLFPAIVWLPLLLLLLLLLLVAATGAQGPDVLVDGGPVIQNEISLPTSSLTGLQLNDAFDPTATADT